ncbi:meteorin-like protein [Amphibalanus amphitrite]|uniref:meteorin-like protein n=1 Tax=Amphibalanus amphitrite TaxID=1232801 RepID=UPI001C90AF03|nr:meteorin-like protein [Amphibalanus amphitrite]
MEVHCWRIGWTLFVCLAAAVTTGEALTCDWKGSGLAHGSPGHVTVVSLGCAAGQVEWRYPQGALRVSLDPSNAFDFRACLRVENGSRGARLFVEGHRRLQLLWAEDDGQAVDKWRCFASRGGSASLYVEAPGEAADPLGRSGVTFEYDAQPTETGRLWDDMEDCRPCTDEEALLNYCTSDFVVRGRITSVEHHEHLDRSALFVRADRVIRQTNDIFRAPTELTVGDAPARDLGNHISERYRPALLDALSGAAEAATEWRGRVHVPRHCGAHEGRGHYILMGRHRLGVPMVTCSLAAEEWRRIKATAERAGTNECMLQA